MRELAELVDREVPVLGGARRTMLQLEQLSAADYRRDGPHGDPAGEPGLLNLTHIALRTTRHALRLERLAVAIGIAEHNECAKTFIASASRKEP